VFLLDMFEHLFESVQHERRAGACREEDQDAAGDRSHAVQAHATGSALAGSRWRPRRGTRRSAGPSQKSLSLGISFALTWVIRRSSSDTEAERRFTFYTSSPILWHRYEYILFLGLETPTRKRFAEHAADMFAQAVLMQQRVIAGSSLQRQFQEPLIHIRWMHLTERCWRPCGDD